MEGYAFLDAAGCGAANGDNPLGIATTVSTKKDNCHVNFLGVDYANWKALVAAFPTARTADATSFVDLGRRRGLQRLPRSLGLRAEKPEQGKGRHKRPFLVLGDGRAASRMVGRKRPKQRRGRDLNPRSA